MLLLVEITKDTGLKYNQHKIFVWRQTVYD